MKQTAFYLLLAAWLIMLALLAGALLGFATLAYRWIVS